MSKKTIKVDEIKDIVNSFLLHSKDEYEERRIGMCVALEKILFDTDNYHGFKNLNPGDMLDSKDGKTPGIQHYDFPKTNDEPDTRYEDCLSFRRYYF